MYKDINHQAVIKSNNKSSVIKALWKYSPVSRTDLAKLTRLNKATITNLVNEIIAEGMVTEIGQKNNGVGRSSNLIMFNKNYGLCAGVSFSTTNLSVVITDVYAKILWRKDFDFNPKITPYELLDEIANLIRTGLKECEWISGKLLGIGIGVPSLVNNEKGIMLGTPSINWFNVPFGEYFRQNFNVPIYMDTISNNAVIGEKWFGAAAENSSVIYLRIGRGIGAGIIINGELFTGGRGFAGDVSHMVIDTNGPLCPCGKRGCWEVTGSALNLQDSVKVTVQKANMGDPDAIMALDNIGCSIGLGICNLVHILNPELILIGGSIAQADTWIMNPCINTMKKSLDSPIFNSTTVKFAELGEDSSIVGAVTRVIEKIFET